jgi:signal transduction histidine kinase
MAEQAQAGAAQAGAVPGEEARSQALRDQAARAEAVAAEHRRLYAEAQEAIRARDEFLSVAAHELRTPVTALRGFAQLALRQMKRGTFDNERGRLILEEIDEQTVNLTSLVNQLLDISRLDVGRLVLQRAPIDLVATVAAAVRVAQASASDHMIRIYAPPVLPALLDATRIEQVLLNIVENSVKFSPAGGAIDVEVTLPLPSTVQVAVRDHGPTIPLEQLEHIFDRFGQVHHGDAYWGLGLGLFLSRKIAQLHGGVLSVDAPPGGGTRFLLMLPVPDASGAAEDEVRHGLASSPPATTPAQRRRQAASEAG